MISRYINRLFDFAFLKPALPLWKARNRGRGLILLYHRINEEGDIPFLDKGLNPFTSPEQFQNDIRQLKTYGAKFVTATQILEEEFSDGFYVAITIDDGFKSNYQVGQDICDSERVPQTIFQCSAMTDQDPLNWEHLLYFLYFHETKSKDFRLFLSKRGAGNGIDAVRKMAHPNQLHRLCIEFVNHIPNLQEQVQELPKYLYPSHEQIKNFATLPTSELGSHGVDHWPRSSISNDDLEIQLVQSKRSLEKVAGTEVTSFSYPFNDYIPEELAQCREHYHHVFSVDPGFINRPRDTRVSVPRNTYPGTPRSTLRQRRWLLTGHI